MKRTSERAIVLKDGRTLGYAEYGDPRGTPIVLFHGMPGSRLAGKIFDQVAQEQQARLLVADRPGYATSSAVHHGSLLGSVDEVITRADALHVDTFAVLGVSGGAPFALACAAKIPECVRCCGLMSGIGPLALPHSMDGMASVNRIFFTPGRFMPTRDRCTCVETGESVDEVNAALYRRGRVPTGRCLARGLCAADGRSA